METHVDNALPIGKTRVFGRVRGQHRKFLGRSHLHQSAADLHPSVQELRMVDADGPGHQPDRRPLFEKKRLHLGGSIAVFDMRTTFYRAAPPERSLAHLMTAQMARFYGASFSGHALLTDAKRPTFEAGAQKAMNALLLLLAGGNIWYPVGLLSADEICSPIQMILDNEILDILRHYQKEFEVTEDSLGFEAVLEAGPGGHFMDKDHTARYYRQEVWEPSVFTRQMLRGWMDAGGMLDVDKAQQRALDFLQMPPEPSRLEGEEERDILKVIGKAKKALRE